MGDGSDAGRTAHGVPMVSIKDVNKHFGDLHVLKDINLDVDRGAGHRRAGPVRFGQIDVVPHHQSARDHRLGHHRDRRRGAARRGTQAGAAALRRRHGVPVVQSVRAQDDSGERHAGADEGPQGFQGRGPQEGDGAAGARRHRQPGGQVPRTAVRRPAAAGGDRPVAGDEPQGDAVRRADQRARPGDDQRGAGGDDLAGQGRHDDDRGDPRDGLRPRRRQPGGLHGRRRDRRGRRARRSSSPTRSPTAPRTSSARSSTTERTQAPAKGTQHAVLLIARR